MTKKRSNKIIASSLVYFNGYQDDPMNSNILWLDLAFAFSLLGIKKMPLILKQHLYTDWCFSFKKYLNSNGESGVI